MWKIYKGEMFIRKLATTMIYIFFKSILNFQIIIKSFHHPNDNTERNPEALLGLTVMLLPY